MGTKISTTAKPNDVIVRSDDNIYFTDPDSGFYRISPTGTVSAAMKFTNSSRPNGIELSLDENTLYVGDVGNSTIVKYTLAADGSVMGSGTMFAMAQSGHNTFDGMCVDCAGNVYVGTSGGVEVWSPTGTFIGTVNTGESSNCTFAGADRKTMYVTSRSVLKYITLNVPGLPD
jgi:gluconolactonase